MTNAVKIWTNKPSLLEIPECVPRSAAKFLPEWFKNAPTTTNQNPNVNFPLSEKLVPQTVKVCPAMQEFLCEGIIIPAWCDMYFAVDDNGGYHWKTSCDDFKLEIHPKEQFLDHSPAWIRRDVKAVFKAVSPWYIQTPPGYSVYQMPLFYQFNEDFTVLPGTVQTDRHFEINQPVLFHSEKKEFMIERGTPFALYIPYKRESLDYLVMAGGEVEKKMLEDCRTNLTTKFNRGYRLHTDRVCPMHEVKNGDN